MKKYSLLVGLLMSGLLVLPLSVSAKKSRRYIKRQHGAKFSWNLPNFQVYPAGQNETAVTDLYAAYTYNWKGRVEVGPYVGFAANVAPFSLGKYSAGLAVEYNFVKNQGRWRYIPALGLAGGIEGIGGETGGLEYAVGLIPAMKFFVGKRTPFTVAIGYKMLIAPGESPSHNVVGSMGFSYYFDFN